MSYFPEVSGSMTGEVPTSTGTHLDDLRACVGAATDISTEVKDYILNHKPVFDHNAATHIIFSDGDIDEVERIMAAQERK